MKEEFKNNLPKWYMDDSKKDLVLSDDIDGLVSCSLLHKVHPNWNIEYFYDFENFMASGEVKNKENKADTRVWSDVALLKNEMCFDNHISRKSLSDYINPLCINPNIMTYVTNENYYKKYCGSTALVIWSVYNLPLPTTEEGKMLLLCIDSTFKGFYYNSFRDRNKFYLCDVLGLEELYEVEKRHTKSEFYELIEKYNLSAKTECVNGKLNTELNLELIGEVLGVDLILPEITFYEHKTFTKLKGTCPRNIKSVKDIRRVVTLAFTGKDYIMCSTINA